MLFSNHSECAVATSVLQVTARRKGKTASLSRPLSAISAEQQEALCDRGWQSNHDRTLLSQLYLMG